MFTQNRVILSCFFNAGIEEHFRDKCGGLPSWIDKMGYYVVFIEGWALYSENPLLSKDVDLYKDNLLQKYGMLKWQVSLCGSYLSVSEYTCI